MLVGLGESECRIQKHLAGGDPGGEISAIARADRRLRPSIGEKPSRRPTCPRLARLTDATGEDGRQALIEAFIRSGIPVVSDNGRPLRTELGDASGIPVYVSEIEPLLATRANGQAKMPIADVQTALERVPRLAGKPITALIEEAIQQGVNDPNPRIRFWATFLRARSNLGSGAKDLANSANSSQFDVVPNVVPAAAPGKRRPNRGKLGVAPGRKYRYSPRNRMIYRFATSPGFSPQGPCNFGELESEIIENATWGTSTGLKTLGSGPINDLTRLDSP